MPRGDGTGPKGQGPRTGRGRGPCQGGLGNEQNQNLEQNPIGRLGERLRQGMRRQESGKDRNRRPR